MTERPRIASDWVPDAMKHVLQAGDADTDASAAGAWCFWDIANSALGVQGRGHVVDLSRVQTCAERLAGIGGGRIVLVTDAFVHPAHADNEAASDQLRTIAAIQRMASTFAAWGVSINLCRVGYTPTLGHQLPEEKLHRLRSHQVVRRDTAPQDLDHALRFLLIWGPANLVGETLALDGGLGWTLVRSGSGRSTAGVFPRPPRHLPFAEHRVLVTGAQSAIGRAIVDRLTARGASLILTGRDAAALSPLADRIRDAGRECQVIQADLAQPDAAEQLWIDVEGLAPTALVYGAGSFRLDPCRPSVAQKALFQVNFLSWATLAERAAESWKMQGRPGALVSIGSLSSHIVTGPGLSSYAASKAAMTQLTSHLAVTYARYGIRSGTVSPGGVSRTGMAEGRDAKFLQAAVERVPSGRFSQPDEVARVVEYLIDPRSEMTAGKPIRLCGGVSTLQPAPSLSPDEPSCKNLISAVS